MLDFVQRRLNGESTRRSRRSRRSEQEELRQRMTHLGHLSAASRRRKAEERRQAEAASRPTPAAGVPLSWPELVRHAYASGSWSALGLPSADEVAALVVGTPTPPAEIEESQIRRVPVSDSSQEATESRSDASLAGTRHHEPRDSSQAVGTPGNTAPGPVINHGPVTAPGPVTSRLCLGCGFALPAASVSRVCPDCAPLACSRCGRVVPGGHYDTHNRLCATCYGRKPVQVRVPREGAAYTELDPWEVLL